MLVYSQHAKLRVSQRNIKDSEVGETILNADETFSSFGNRQIARKAFKEAVLEVVYKLENENTIVITAYWQHKEPQ